MGKLKVARGGHGVIQVDREFIVVGGDRTGSDQLNEPTESCKLDEHDKMTCTTRQPQLSNFEYYPELMLIP